MGRYFVAIGPLVTFLGGLIGLLLAGHLVIRAAAALGAKFGLSPMVIGLTIVAGGTSAPEIAVVFQAINADDTELAVGSIVGSNIANVLLVLGLAATAGTIHVTSRVLRIDVPIMIATSTALLLASLDGNVGRVDGGIFLFALSVFIWWTFRSVPNEAEPVVAEISGPVERRRNRRRFDRMPTLIGSLIAGLAALVFTSRFVVSGAEDLANQLGIPELVIGLTVLALGTSAPEIATTLIAAFQGNRQLAVGNVVGSNIFNILLVLGLGGAVSGNIEIAASVVRIDLPVMVAAAVACLPLLLWDNRLDPWEGMAFVSFYVAYVVFLTLDAGNHEATNAFAFIVAAIVAPLTILTAMTLAFRRRRSHVRPTTPQRNT